MTESSSRQQRHVDPAAPALDAEREQAYRLLCGLAAIGALALMVARGLPVRFDLESAALLAVAALAGLGGWAITTPLHQRRFATGLLAGIAGLAFVFHAIRATAPNALQQLGVVTVFASLLLEPKAFRRFAVLLVAGVLGSRSVRWSMGLLEDGNPSVALIHVVGGFAAFTVALWGLDRQHREARAAFEAAMERTQRLQKHAVDAAHRKGQFLANMSHELRTPMNAILGYAELLSEDIDDEEDRDVLDRVAGEGRHLLDQINDVLNAANEDVTGAAPLHADNGPTTSQAVQAIDGARGSWARGVLLASGAVAGGVDLLATGIGWAAGAPIHPRVSVFSLLFAGTIFGLGWARRLTLGVLMLIWGGGILLAVSTASVFEAPNLEGFVFLLLVLSALVQEWRPFLWSAAGITLMMGIAKGTRYALGWTDLTGALDPWIAIALVAIALAAVVARRHRDEGALKVQAEAATRALVAASRADESRSRFIAKMSHGIRTPLNSVLGYSELLGEQVSPDLRADVERIRTASLHLLGIIDDVLDMQGIEQGQFSFNPQAVSVGELCQRAIELTRPGIEANGNRLVLALGTDGVDAWADPRLAIQILVNLLGNAGKFTRDGVVEMSGVVKDNEARLSVRDTGAGLAPEDCARLFVPFERLAASPDVAGTGLGLSIAREMARLHGGDLVVESEVGVGSTFTVHLPLAPDDAGDARAASEGTGG